MFKGINENMDLTYTPFENLIKEKTGLVFNRNQAERLRDGIHEMMLKKGYKSHSEYFKKLCLDADEFVDLVGHLTINETYFFREPNQMKVLSERIIPEVLARKKAGEKVKIMSAGCSTGAEPYSIVIAIMERYGANIKNLFSVTGFDIDGNAIRNAVEGVYGKQYFRSLDPDLKEKYFDGIGNDRYEIKPFVKKLVRFHNFNLFSDYYPDVFREMDIIFYRNVSIYFEQEKQRKIFQNLSNVLNINGYLIMSSTETLPHDINILPLAELDGVFLYRKIVNSYTEGTPRRLAFSELSKNSFAGGLGFPSETEKEKPDFSFMDALTLNEKKYDETNAGITIPPSKNPDEYYTDALFFANSKKYRESIEILDNLITSHPAFIRAYTLKAEILVNLQQIKDAKNVCLKALEIDQFCIEVYLLLGLIARLENDYEQAVRRYKEALYVKNSNWLARFNLAEIYQAQGKREQASREFENVLNIIERGGFDDFGLSFFSFMFTPKQIQNLCRHNMHKLKTGSAA